MHTDVRESEQREAKYTTPSWVQRWFLTRSRNGWKTKYKVLKAASKVLQNRVNDMTKSREKWRHDAKELVQRVRELEAENAVLRERAAASKKHGQRTFGSG